MEFDVPEGETPAVVCPYCDRPFASEEYGTYHVGIAHPERASPEELERFEAARDVEEDDLFTFHLLAAVSVFLVYFLFTFIYALVWAD